MADETQQQPQTQETTPQRPVDQSKLDGTGPVQIPQRKKISEYPIIAKDGKRVNPEEVKQQEPGEPGEQGLQPGDNKVAPTATQEATTPAQVIDLSTKGLVFKMGDEEIGGDTISTALQALKQKENWEKSFTQKSQVVNFVDRLPEEQRGKVMNKILAMAYGKEKVEDFLKDAPEKLYITLKDEDGYDNGYEINLGNPDDPLVKELFPAFEQIFLKKYDKTFKDLQEAYGKLGDYESRAAAAQEEAGEVAVRNWTKEHPEFQISLNEGENLKQKMSDILVAGEAHPDYKKVERLITIARKAQENNLSFEQAYDILYGGIVQKSKQTAKTQQIKQNAPDREPPGSRQPVPMTERERMLAWNRNPKSQRVQALFDRFDESIAQQNRRKSGAG